MIFIERKENIGYGILVKKVYDLKIYMYLLIICLVFCNLNFNYIISICYLYCK